MDPQQQRFLSEFFENLPSRFRDVASILSYVHSSEAQKYLNCSHSTYKKRQSILTTWYSLVAYYFRFEAVILKDLREEFTERKVGQVQVIIQNMLCSSEEIGKKLKIGSNTTRKLVMSLSRGSYRSKFTRAFFQRMVKIVFGRDKVKYGTRLDNTLRCARKG